MANPQYKHLKGYDKRIETCIWIDHCDGDRCTVDDDCNGSSVCSDKICIPLVTVVVEGVPSPTASSNIITSIPTSDTDITPTVPTTELAESENLNTFTTSNIPLHTSPVTTYSVIPTTPSVVNNPSIKNERTQNYSMNKEIVIASIGAIILFFSLFVGLIFYYKKKQKRVDLLKSYIEPVLARKSSKGTTSGYSLSPSISETVAQSYDNRFDLDKLYSANAADVTNFEDERYGERLNSEKFL
ncbi:hypothetical protein HK099_006505 [Clydaea vesicula]|uniref:Uncharacterized protein n=1 Tax=Clydaea vesicula TaxID=447962 RepID=A0AAD5TXK1_9FUNG|nr:hypothetical protein HK099_006505 [Clydaea vesicula]